MITTGVAGITQVAMRIPELAMICLIRMQTMQEKMMKNTILVVLLALMSLTFVGCEKKGPAERAGEQIDEVVKDVGNDIEDACEDIKDAAGAKDDDC